MKSVYLGNSGLVVSNICLGTNMFGGRVDLETAREIVNRFRENGGTFIDTAGVYNGGESERVLGEIVGREREALVLATKVYGSTGPNPNDAGVARRHLLRGVDDSLRRLRTEYLDVLQLHRWDPTTPVEELLETIEDLVRSGKVLYVGASNYVGWQLERCLQVQSQRGFTRFVSLQSQYSLHERGLELETLDVVIDHNLTLMAWSPLAAGLLSGKYHRDSINFQGQLAKRSGDDVMVDDRSWNIIDVLRKMSRDLGYPIPSIAIAWLISQGRVIPVIGASTPDQLDDTMAGGELQLTEDAINALSQSSDIFRPYPYSGFPLVEGRPHPVRW